MNKKLLLYLFIVTFGFGQEYSVVINEFLASSENCCGAEIFGNGVDFVELYNYGTDPIDITGWGFSDTDGSVTTTAPDTSISSGGFLVLWYTGNASGFPEIDEKLSSSGETIFIADQNGNTVITYDYDSQTEDVSYGRYPDGSDTWQYFNNPTPGAANLVGCNDGEVELWGECYSIENTTEIFLPYSSLTGEIPSEIGNLTNLTSLHLNENQLTGSIPSEIGNLTNLNNLNLYNNQLTGSIPPEIGNLTNLVMLNLGSNELTGEIPSEIGSLTNLSILWLFANQLTGSIPPEIGNMTSLTGIGLSNNQLTGSIPLEIGILTNLDHLRLYDNQLTGAIPESICDLNINWSSTNSFTIYNNQLCPPYPSCIEEYVGEQDTSNCEQVSIISETLPITYNLYSAYPNPFNPVTTLRYDLPEDGLINITIYDMMGRVVKTMVNTEQNAGFKSVRWNATNDNGAPVSAGIYLYMIQAGEFRQTKKMVLLK